MVLVIDAVQVLAANLYRTFFPKQGQRAFHVFPVTVHRIIKGANNAICKLQDHGAGIFKLNNALVCTI